LCHGAPDLARRTLLIDRATFPRDKVCAGALGARADRLLSRIGVQVDVPAAPAAGLRVRALGRELTARLPKAPVARVVRRRDYDAALLDRVRERGVTVRTGVALRRIDRRLAAVTLSTSAGEITARALVGADGVGSTVRRQLGLPRGRYHAQAVEVDTPWSPSERERDLLHFDLSDEGLLGYAWTFPTPVAGELMACRGVYRLVRGVAGPNPGAQDGGAEGDIADRLRLRLQTAGIDPAGLRLRRHAERGLALHEPFAVSRVALVGEAAGIDPVLGEGIAQAIHYGSTAAAYLARCFAHRDYRFGDYRTTVLRSRVGVDLRIRAAMAPFIYGRTRPLAMRWLTRSHHLGAAGACYLAGQRVARRRLAGALFDLTRLALWPGAWRKAHPVSLGPTAG